VGGDSDGRKAGLEINKYDNLSEWFLLRPLLRFNECVREGKAEEYFKQAFAVRGGPCGAAAADKISPSKLPRRVNEAAREH